MTLDPRKVTPVLVTRGDVDLAPIVDSLPYGEPVIWNNASRPRDEKVFGRYLGIAEAKNRVIYFQDDDCIPPPAAHELLLAAYEPGVVVGNAIDDPVRLAKYHDTTLLGWGALFDAELPGLAFARYARHHVIDDEFRYGLGAEITFPMLTPSKTVLGGIEWLEEPDGPVFRRPNRMWLQPGFYSELDFWLARARAVRDAEGLA